MNDRPPEPTPVPDAAAAGMWVDTWNDATGAGRYWHECRTPDRALIEAAIRAEPPAPSMPPAVGLDMEAMREAVERAMNSARVQCRCGKWPLLDNWSNHRLRKDGRPHRPVFDEAARSIAAEYARLAPAVAPVGDDR